MPRRTIEYRKIKALEDVRKLEQLTALEDLGKASMPDPSAEIPGTGPEKMVFNYLKRLGVRFQFQYHEADFESSAFPEDIYIPDFILPDYNSRINVFGTYWHSLSRRREKDILNAGMQLYAGRMIIEHGIPLAPSVGEILGKYIIWWEYEIYFDLAHLFARDLPELFSPDRIMGQPEQYILDREEQERIAKARISRLVATKLKPKVHPLERRLKRLRRQNFDINKIY
ncbi:unnamed protein product, partial [marine sediment metagenome]